MFLSAIKLANLAVVALAMAQSATSNPLTSPYSTTSPITAGVSVQPERLHNSTVQNHAAVLAGSHKARASSGGNGLEKRETGDIEAHWQFVQEETVCGDYGTVCFSPWAYLWVDWYANGATSPTCSDGWDITEASTSDTLSGQAYYSYSCDLYFVFDANNAGGDVQTFGAGRGIVCGWVTSWDHTSFSGGLDYTQDYYYHCTW